MDQADVQDSAKFMYLFCTSKAARLGRNSYVTLVIPRIVLVAACQGSQHVKVLTCGMPVSMVGWGDTGDQSQKRRCLGGLKILVKDTGVVLKVLAQGIWPLEVRCKPLAGPRWLLALFTRQASGQCNSIPIMVFHCRGCASKWLFNNGTTYTCEGSLPKPTLNIKFVTILPTVCAPHIVITGCDAFK
eukprot:1146324-Pelagomonas_calceolata.AAC.6